MAANINPETGIAYGYISANCLNSDIVDELMAGGKDIYAEEAFSEWKSIKTCELFDTGKYDSIADAEEAATNISYEFWDDLESTEPVVEGEYNGVKYASSWLGGALQFFVFMSPHITEKARLASPCVPNAGILDTLDGDVIAYDVPGDWRHTDK